MPKMFFTKLGRLFRRLAYGYLPGGARVCAVCGNCVWRFMPYRDGFRVASMDALGFVSGDMANFGCPRCGAHDRERHLLLYFNAVGLADSIARYRVLHFAPERHFGRIVKEMGPAEYVPCDLFPASPDIRKVDMEAMPFGDCSFDLVIANHVLEHVSDDSKALSEIHRVLRPGGYAILQTPYSRLLHATFSDPGLATDAARLHAYGQEDHVRLYGRDIISRFESSGLVSRVASHDELLAGIDCVKYGVGRGEPFFLFQREE